MLGTAGGTFGHEQFGSAPLGDVRRTRRLVALADAFLERPDDALPRKCGSPAAYSALLHLLDQPTVTHDTVLDHHRARTHDALRARGPTTTLLIGDITELDFTSRRSLADQLGPIGDGRGSGYECFNLLAVDPTDRAVLGLVAQLLFRRRRTKLSRARVRALPADRRQSGLWVRATDGLEGPPPGARWVRVFDREGDTDEVLDDPRDYLIRSRTNRRVRLGPGADAPEGRLHAHLRVRPAVGFREVQVGAAPGRAARVARCAVSFAPVWVRGAAAFGVRVWEPEPPAGSEAVEWLLLSDVPVETAADACERIDWYECRWVVEEYHKALKSGVGIERPQVTSSARLEPLIGVLSVVALELLWVRSAARDESRSGAAAETVVCAAAVAAARGWGGVPAQGPVTVGELFRAVARLGGYMGTFRAKPPGWQTLWHGWIRLHTRATAIRTAERPT
jgi:Transposase DNA-binding